METWLPVDGLPQSDVPRQRNDRHTAASERRLYGNFQNTGHLFGLRDQFTVMAALPEQVFRVRFLEIVAADFKAWNLSGDRKDGYTAAMTVVEAVDQMKI